MGNRLSRIYTRTGDDGTTGLSGGRRVRKDHIRIECIGTVDELNSALGMALAQTLPPAVREALAPIQHRLFDIGAELSMPEFLGADGDDVSALEQRLDALNGELPPLKEFILPGGNPAAASLHFARTVCRRAERQLFTLAAEEAVNPATLRYLNRLSDLLFVTARLAARQDGGTEVYWQARSS